MNAIVKKVDALNGEQVGFLYRHLPTSLLINALLGAILVAVQGRVAPAHLRFVGAILVSVPGQAVSAHLRFGWLAAFYVVLMVRAALLVLWRNAHSSPAYDARRWLNRFRITASATGLAWGVGSIALSPSGDVVHQVYVAFVLGGLCAGAIISLAIDRVSLVGFLLPTVVPFIAYLSLQGNEVSLGMSAMVLLFLVFVMASARLIERTLHENFSLRIKAVENETRFRTMLELSPIAACVTAADTRRILFANQSYAQLLGMSLERVMDVDPSRFYLHADEYADALKQIACGEKVAGQLMKLGVSDEPDGQKWVLATYLNIEYEGGSAVLAWLYDITDRKQAEDHAKHLAHHDPLTELPNRTLLHDRLKQALALAGREKSMLALMFVDLDHFKSVNDAHGHNVGDLLLVSVARRLRDCVRQSDSVARIGGDEFVVLLARVESVESAMLVAGKIQASLNESFVLGGRTLHISPSIGVAVYPDHADNEHELLNVADIAMYYAKAEGRDSVRLYQAGMESGRERP